MPHALDLLSLMVNTPLLAHPRKVGIVFSVLRQRAHLSGIDAPQTWDAARVDALWKPGAEASEFTGSNPPAEPGSWLRREPFRMERGVAIITTVGSLVNRGAWVGNDGSGLTTYEGFKFQLQRAVQFSQAKAIILDIETPGGQAIGAFEAAQAVREAAAIKPVYAVVNGMAASAGYAIASGATRIITTQSGLSGSIGVVALHLDHSQQLADEGIKPTFIHAGAHKVDGNPLEPLGDDVKEEWQAEITATYELFLDTVAEGRGSRLSKTRARDTQARTFMGQAAVDAGLADAVGTFEEVLNEAASRAARTSGPRSTQGKSKMSALGIDDQGQGQTQTANTTQTQAPVSYSQAQMDAAIQAAVAKASTDAHTAGATAAQVRLDAILADTRTQGRESAALAYAKENPSASAEQVCSFVDRYVPLAGASADPKARQSIAERALASGVNNVSGGPVTNDPARPGGEASTEDAAIKAGWAAARRAASAHMVTPTKQ
jgi:signal peptide peptidase SppA